MTELHEEELLAESLYVTVLEPLMQKPSELPVYCWDIEVFVNQRPLVMLLVGVVTGSARDGHVSRVPAY